VLATTRLRQRKGSLCGRGTNKQKNNKSKIRLNNRNPGKASQVFSSFPPEKTFSSGSKIYNIKRRRRRSVSEAFIHV
jgi:hypothetical protein